MRVVLNPLASREPYTSEESAIVSRAHAVQAHAEISCWPDYSATPLRSLQGFARQLGVQRVLYKDESARLRQGSFKILGGAYAATVKLRGVRDLDRITLCCATDGNHGRSVAFAAKRHGCRCVVFMHEQASAAKAAAIEALGASVVRVPGTYDDAVHHARATATRQGWMLIADTSEDELDPTTRLVMQGYGVMVLEILEQLRDAALPTHVVLQAGVGALAAAVAGLFAEMYGEQRPTIIVVEPDSAACLLASALHGTPVKVTGDLLTAMDMLSAGEVSPVAWPILKRRVDAFVSISDATALATTRLLSGEPLALDVGVSGAAGVAGLAELSSNAAVARALRLDGGASVLTFGTEESGRSSVAPA
jgi:diaminopropionate ammonia-lyase